MSEQRLLSHGDLRKVGIHFSKSQLWRLTKVGKFPKPVQVGLRRVAWVKSEIDEWISERVAGRDRSAA